MIKKHIVNLVVSLGVIVAFNSHAQEASLSGAEASIAEPTATASSDKKTFTDEEGNLYWNLELPVYLSMSTTPEGKDAHMLKKVKNAKMETYTNPMYFDGHGVHYIRHLDYENPVPESEEAFEIRVDGRRPVTTAKFLDAPKFVTSGKTFYGKGLRLEMIGEDEMSGIDQIFYSFSGTQYMAYQKDVKLNEEKSYMLNYYSMDNVGNKEEAKKKEFYVDLTAPATAMEINGDQLNDIISPRAELSLKSSDNNSGVKTVYLNFDDNSEKVYSIPFKLYNLKEGEHILNYYSVDNVDNKEEIHTYKFYLDRTAPEVSSEVVGDFHQVNGKTFISKRSKIKIEATDNKAGVDNIYYVLNGKSEQLYAGPFQIEASQGNQRLAYKAVDKVNNATKFKTDGNIGNGTVFLDDTPPVVSHSFSGAQFLTRDTMFITSETKVILKASDYHSGMQKITYQLDKKAEATYQDPLTVPNEGLHSIGMKGFDYVNNTKEDEFVFMIDNKGPEIFSHFSIDKIGTQQLEDKKKAISVYPKHALLYLAATDAMVGTDRVYYSINGAAEKIYTGPIKVTTAGLKVIAVRAVDKLGNVVEGEPIEYVIQ